MLCAIGAFQIWRRDLLEELGGWSREYTCEDIELTFRVHRVLREQRRRLPGRVPAGLDRRHRGPGHGAQARRAARALAAGDPRDVVGNRRMCFNPRYGTVGMLGMPYYLLSEIVAPVFELLAVATLVAGAVAGLVDWWRVRRRHAAASPSQQRLLDGRARSWSTSTSGLSVARHRPAPRADAARAVRLPARSWRGPGSRARGASSAATRGGTSSSGTSRVGRHEPCDPADEGGAPAARCVGRGRRGRDRLGARGGAHRAGLWLATAAALALALDRAVRVLVRRAPARRRSPTRCTASGTPPAALLSALPDGLLVVRDGRICSVNREPLRPARLRPRRAPRRDGALPVLAARAPARDRGLARRARARGEHVAELTFRIGEATASACSPPAGSSPTRAGRRHLVTVRDVSASHRRERRLAELAARTPRRGSSTGASSRSGSARPFAARSRRDERHRRPRRARRCTAGRGRGLRRPEALLAVERLRRGSGPATTSRAPATASSPGSSPRPTPPAALEAVERWRAELADVDGVELTAGVCDLATAGDALRALRPRRPGALDRARGAARDDRAHAPTVRPRRRTTRRLGRSDTS